MTKSYKFYTKKELIEGEYNNPRNIVEELQDDVMIYNLLIVCDFEPVRRKIKDMCKDLSMYDTGTMARRVVCANREFAQLIMKSDIPAILEMAREEIETNPVNRCIYVHTEGNDNEKQ